jgi:hypothetical protein
MAMMSRAKSLVIPAFEQHRDVLSKAASTLSQIDGQPFAQLKWFQLGMQEGSGYAFEIS